MVVADGSAGAVAHFTPELDLVGLWHSGGANEIELTGYATTRGVLISGRWSARESRVGWLTSDGSEDLCDGYNAYAIPADDDRFWLVDDDHLALMGHASETIAAVPSRTPREGMFAADASGAVPEIRTDRVSAADAVFRAYGAKRVDVTEPHRQES
ncbi:hypothetical protein [Nonomuraea sp. NPDC049695]|uniref:hypothetical protein n=1 Tax=Nonomuraea sp. NPDC049695 TaxID=3154734 RepID=UPI0034274767